MTTTLNVSNITLATLTIRNAGKLLTENGITKTVLDAMTDEEIMQKAKDLLAPKQIGEMSLFDKYKAGKLGTSGNSKSLMSSKTLALFGINEPSTEANDFLGMRKLYALLSNAKLSCTVKNAKGVSPKMVANLNKEVQKTLITDGIEAIKYLVEISAIIDSEKAVTFEIAKTTLVGKMESSIFDKIGFATLY